MTAQEAHPIPRTRGSRIVVGAFVAFLLGVLFLGVGANSSITPLFHNVVAIALFGVVPVVVVALAAVRLILAMQRLHVPLIGQALATGLSGAVVCGALAGVVFAVIGEGGFLFGYLAAAVAGWCGFFGVLIGAALQRSRSLFRVALALSGACVVAGAVLMIGS